MLQNMWSDLGIVHEEEHPPSGWFNKALAWLGVVLGVAVAMITHVYALPVVQASVGMAWVLTAVVVFLAQGFRTNIDQDDVCYPPVAKSILKRRLGVISALSLVAGWLLCLSFAIEHLLIGGVLTILVMVAYLGYEGVRYRGSH